MEILKQAFWMKTEGKAKSADIVRYVFHCSRWHFYELLNRLRLVSNTKREKEQKESLKAIFEKIYPYVLPEGAFENACEMVEALGCFKIAQRMREAREARGR